MLTWTRKDRRVQQDAHCLICGNYYGICKGEHRAHKPTVCLACGSSQCWTHGLAHGSCGVCLYGMLPAFSHSGHTICGYKGCDKNAVAFAPRVKQVCKDHLAKAGLAQKIADALARRAQSWDEVNRDITLYPIL